MSLVFLAVAFLVGYFAVAPHSSIDSKIAPIVKPHQFSIAGWQFHTITRKEIPSMFRREDSADIAGVLEYFENAQQARSLQSTLDYAQGRPSAEAKAMQSQLDSLRKRQDSLAGGVQATIEKQITDTLREQRIYNPLANLWFSFPPVNFELARPPDVLVVSPRDRIESISETTLRPGLTLDNVQEIESRVDKLNVSSLVTGIGGLAATFPTFVADDMGLEATIDTAAHEWVHQYLIFRPLGFRYVLDLVGIAPNRDITSMTETLADMIGTEIGDLVYEKYYKDMLSPPDGEPSRSVGAEEDSPTAFDFNAEMRAIRKHVDSLLSQGKVDEAEQYMNGKRAYLAEHGYYIRRLNQAYFAFYGSYTDSPMSVDPIGVEMKQLRNEAGSVRQFLDLASSLSSREALRRAAEP